LSSSRCRPPGEPSRERTCQTVAPRWLVSNPDGKPRRIASRWSITLGDQLLVEHVAPRMVWSLTRTTAVILRGRQFQSE